MVEMLQDAKDILDRFVVRRTESMGLNILQYVVSPEYETHRAEYNKLYAALKESISPDLLPLLIEQIDALCALGVDISNAFYYQGLFDGVIISQRENMDC